MNILYLHSHDTGRWVEPYGHSVATPRLQQLAAEGVLFRQAFCTNPTCSPSRASLLSGQWPHSCGMLGLAHRGFAMNDYSEHLVQILIEAGYRTYLSGIQHEAEDWRTVGYHECIGDRPDAHTRAAEFLRSAPAVSKMGASHSDAAQPFFLSVGFFETHREFPELDSDDEALYVQPPAVYPNAPETRRDFARFRKSAALLDDKIGTVLDALDESGLRDNTLVLCTTDHGPAFPRMKCNLTDAGIGVMLILRGPDGFDGGRIIDGMVSQIDILPTLCELIDLPVPEHAQGHSLMPLVRDECDEVNDAIFAEVNFHGSYEPVRCIRTHRWKYIRRYYEGYLPSCDVGETRSRWLERGWADRPLPAEELYDLELDPSERTNLAADAHFAPVRDPLAGRLDEWMLQTDDPLLNGPIFQPPGTRLLDEPNCQSDAKIPLDL